MTPDSYGDVTGEYRALHDGAGLLEGGYEAVGVGGPDAESFLDSLLSQDLTALAEGAASRSLLLAPRGKLRALLWVGRLPDEFVLVTDAGSAEVVAADLSRFKLRVDATIGDPEPVAALIGPAAAAVLAGASLPAPSGVARHSESVVLHFPLGHLDRFFLLRVPSTSLLAAGARPVGALAATAVRVEAGEPRMGRDVDESTIPQESGLVAEAVSFTKGCYLGQELVARIDSRGHVNRHLRGVVIKENRLPPEQARLVVDGADVGVLTSIAESLMVGAPVGLGLVRREVEPPRDAIIRWEGGETAGEIRALPLVPHENHTPA